jgi:peptidoglycan/LPS O-acetylase OafA/YrhL
VKKNRIDLSRITTSGNFIPEIDGLRFIAIISVVLFHLYGFISEKDGSTYTTNYNFDFIANFLKNGNFGVELFFVLSGFILGLPFAKHHLLKEKKVSLKSYFYRRVSRLEPPYIIVMFLLLLGVIFVSKNYNTSEAIQSFLASITYTHNFIYGKDILPLINTVAWSLEIEIQFYILAPVLSLLFSISNKINRRSILILLTLSFSVISLFLKLPFISILDYLHYFLLGFILVDLFLIEKVKKKTSLLRNTLTVLSLLLIFSCNKNQFSSDIHKIIWNISLLVLIFGSYYNVILYKSLKFFSLKIITNIGGMCYSIYLLHFAIISFAGNPLLTFQFSENSIINIGLYSIIILGCILVISALFFIVIERPCMDKNWPIKIKKIWKRN